jgi:hypothetical protein
MEEGGGAPPPGWPGNGCIEYQGVAAVYRKGLPPVLRDLTFTIPVRCVACCRLSCGSCVGRQRRLPSAVLSTLKMLLDSRCGEQSRMPVL